MWILDTIIFFCYGDFKKLFCRRIPQIMTEDVIYRQDGMHLAAESKCVRHAPNRLRYLAWFQLVELLGKHRWCCLGLVSTSLGEGYGFKILLCHFQFILSGSCLWLKMGDLSYPGLQDHASLPWQTLSQTKPFLP